MAHKHATEVPQLAQVGLATERWRGAKPRRRWRAILWLPLYLLLVCAPVAVLMLVAPTPGIGFWHELAVGLGFSGLALMIAQLVLTARLKVIEQSIGMDTLYLFHKYVAFAAVALLSGHVLVMLLYQRAHLEYLNVWTAPWFARAGIIAALSLVILIGTSLWRQQLGLPYRLWRALHGLLACSAVGAAMVHILLIDNYLHLPWKRALWQVYTVFWLGLLVYARVLKPLLLLRHPYQLDAVRAERGQAWTLELSPLGHAGLRFMPGQFAWLSIDRSPLALGEHPFSVASSAARPDGSLSMTIKAVGDFTQRVQQLTPGRRVYLDGAYGGFSIDRYPAERYLFIAGGIGITPIISALRTLADRGDERPLMLIYANRDWEGVTFREALASLEARLDLRVVYVLSKPPEDWRGERGRIDAALLHRYLQGEWQGNKEVFICGPAAMMDAVEGALLALGTPARQLHSERFNLV